MRILSFGIILVFLSAAAMSLEAQSKQGDCLPSPLSVTITGTGFSIPLVCQGGGAWRAGDTEVALAADGCLSVLSPTRRLLTVEIAWKAEDFEGDMLFKDAWERTGGCSGWFKREDFDYSPWFTLVRRSDGAVDGYGVRVQPCSLVCWKAGPDRLTAVLDLSAGGRPLNLGNRRLLAAEFVFRRGLAGEDAFSAGQEFCRLMCPRPRLPKMPVYGYNDWYCAYGKNTATNFLEDASFVCMLAERLENRPYVVMDDGWQPNSPPVVAAYNPNGAGGSGYGPWDRSGDAFGMKMESFAARVKAMGARPGLWYRPYCAWPGADRSMLLKGSTVRFDPTNPKVREAIRADVGRFRQWGFDLVKIDYLTSDLCGCNTRKLDDRVFREDRGWADDTRTSAEVILDLHRTMREAAGDNMIIIGCNALNHLVAGIFEVQRTGDDTSGWVWGVTRDKGVNTLATRAMQDRIFFLADADCVGLARRDAIPWKKNRQWLDLVSRSGTPLFISWHRSLVDDEIRAALTAAFRRAAIPREVGRPLDWLESRTPSHWRFSDGDGNYDWADRVAEPSVPDGGASNGR